MSGRPLTGQDIKKVLVVGVYAGEIMLRSGAETSRVEETITIMMRSFGVQYINNMVTPTGIYVSADSEDMQTPLTLVRRVRSRQLNLNRVAEVNDLSRKTAYGLVTLEEIETQLRRIDQAPDPYPFWIWLVGGAGSAAGATMLLNGSLLDAAVAFLSTVLVQLLLWALDRSRIPAIFGEFLGAAIATAIALPLSWAGLPIHPTLVIAGGIIKLVPGAALLASVQDGISGDLLSSAARGLEAFLKGAAIASGVGLALSGAVALGFNRPGSEYGGEAWQIPIQAAAAFVASSFFAVNNHAPRRAVLWAGIVGAVCWTTYLLVDYPWKSASLATLLAAIAAGFVSWGLARWKHIPVTIVILPGVLPLLPGLIIYNGMLALTQNQTVQGMVLLVQATFLGGAIAAGVAISNTVAPAIWRKPHIPLKKP